MQCPALSLFLGVALLSAKASLKVRFSASALLLCNCYTITQKKWTHLRPADIPDVV